MDLVSLSTKIQALSKRSGQMDKLMEYVELNIIMKTSMRVSIQTDTQMALVSWIWKIQTKNMKDSGWMGRELDMASCSWLLKLKKIRRYIWKYTMGSFSKEIWTVWVFLRLLKSTYIEVSFLTASSMVLADTKTK